MRKIIKAAVLFMVILFALLPGGCGFKDIDKRFFVIAVGIDKGKTAPYEVSLRLAIPSPRTEPGESKFEVVSQESDSIAEAVQLMKSKVDKEFDFGHCKVVFFGKSFSEGDMGHSLDWFFRRRDIQQISYMAVAEPDAKSVIQLKPKSERLPGNALILAFSSEGTESAYIATEPLFDYYRRMRTAGFDPYLPIIKAMEDQFDIARVAIFHDNRKRVELSPDETNIFKQIARGFPRIILKTKIAGENVSFRGLTLRSSYRIVESGNGAPVIRYKVRLEGEAEEAKTSLFDRPWGPLEDQLAKQLKMQYHELLLKLQKSGVDPIGFGLRYRATRHHEPDEIKTWEEWYPDVKFEVDAKVKLKGTGVLK